MRTLAQRFWAKVDTSAGPDGCWPWTGKTNGPSGRGQLRVRLPDGRWGHAYATHVAIQIDTGQGVPAGQDACHTCDNPPCVNPKHLFVSDCAGNMDDCARKLRAAPNTRRLTPEKAMEIIRRRRARERVADLAVEFGVTKGTIYHIERGLTWKWLDRNAA